MNVIQQLIREEGKRSAAYQDHLGFWTIGVGRLIDARKGGGLSDEEIEYLLKNDVARVTKALEAQLPYFKSLNEPRQAVLIGMAFQMGVEGLMKFKQTLAAVRDEHYEHAAECMRQSLWARQTPKRALRMAQQMASGEWQ